MWNRRRTWVLLAALSCVGLTVYFEPTHCVRGWLWGEAFYDGRPTSYWRHELERWDVRLHVHRRHELEWCASMRFAHNIYARESTWFEKQWERWIPTKETELHLRLNEAFDGPPILRDEAGVTVLQSLRDDPSPRVRLLARIGLGMNPDIPAEDD